MMEVKLIAYTPAPDYVAAKGAATCVRKEATAARLRTALRSGHLSVAEHASFTFFIDGISRVLLAQLTRHRHASFSVESQRYCRFDDLLAKSVIPESFERCGVDVAPLLSELQSIYNRMVDAGVPEEDARYILPQAATTAALVTMNARELRHFFKLRCCNKAQWEIRELADRMLALCREAAPVLFEKAGAPCQCGEGCPEVRPCGHPRGASGRKETEEETCGS